MAIWWAVDGREWAGLVMKADAVAIVQRRRRVMMRFMVDVIVEGLQRGASAIVRKLKLTTARFGGCDCEMIPDDTFRIEKRQPFVCLFVNVGVKITSGYHDRPIFFVWGKLGTEQLLMKKCIYHLAALVVVIILTI
jgi:hypothetical protein